MREAGWGEDLQCSEKGSRLAVLKLGSKQQLSASTEQWLLQPQRQPPSKHTPVNPTKQQQQAYVFSLKSSTVRISSGDSSDRLGSGVCKARDAAGLLALGTQVQGLGLRA